MFKKFYREHGLINTGLAVTTLLAVVGALVSVIYANASQRITNLEVKSDTFTVDITTLKANTADIPAMKEQINAIYSGLLSKGLIFKSK